MALCQWPCSCYPNHALGQVNDWMNEIYQSWVAANGVLIIKPVYWYQAPSVLMLMLDRLVCADGGNPDPTTSQGKDSMRAKELELEGWSYPRHLAGRAFGVVVHGDADSADPATDLSARRAASLLNYLASRGLPLTRLRAEGRGAREPATPDTGAAANRRVEFVLKPVIAGREAYLAGRMGKRMYADPSSPLSGLI